MATGGQSHGFEMDPLHPTQTSVDYEPQMKAIGATLKKRFFRKPNVAEAVEQYELLCQELKRDGLDYQAGMCSLEIAKCHEMLQNHTERCTALVKASEYFFDAQELESRFSRGKNKPNHQNTSFYKFHRKAISSLQQAVDLFKEQQLNATALLHLMNMGNKEFRIGDYEKAHDDYKMALELCSSNSQLGDEIDIIEKLLDCKIKIMDHKGAGKLVSITLERMADARADLPIELYHTYTLKFEVIKVFLLLISGSRSVDYETMTWKGCTLIKEEGVTMTDYFSSKEEAEREKIYDALRSLIIGVHQRSQKAIDRVLNRLAGPYLTPPVFQLYGFLIQYL